MTEYCSHGVKYQYVYDGNIERKVLADRMAHAMGTVEISVYQKIVDSEKRYPYCGNATIKTLGHVQLSDRDENNIRCYLSVFNTLLEIRCSCCQLVLLDLQHGNLG